MATLMTQHLTVRLARRRSAPTRARAELAEFEHGLDGARRQDAELLLTELVSNAVKYGEGDELDVTFERTPERFRAEVADQGDGFGFRKRGRRDPDRPGGWGLQLVDLLADSWGGYRGSTHVWFELTIS
jgi:signal transduction histidine kinase